MRKFLNYKLGHEFVPVVFLSEINYVVAKTVITEGFRILLTFKFYNVAL